MKYGFGFTLAMAVASVGCGDGHIQTMLDGAVASDSAVIERDMGSFMFRDASTATCAESGENCLGLPCCGSLMCIVPANGGTPTCNGFLGDGGTSPDATIPVDAAADAAIDAAIDSSVGMDAMIDAAEPDAGEPTESQIRFVVLFGEGAPISLECDDDEDREGTAEPPGTSAIESITSGARRCDIDVNGDYLLEENLPLEIPATPGAFTLAHSGTEGFVWIPEELTAEPNHYYAHFANFYGSSEGVTFYDSSLNPLSDARIGDGRTGYAEYTADGFQLVTDDGTHNWYFGVDVDNNETPDAWFMLPRDSAFSTETNPVVNFFFYDNGRGLEFSRIFAQMPGGDFLTLWPIFDATLELRATVLGQLSTTGAFGSVFGPTTIDIRCPGPEGLETVLRTGPEVDFVPRNFRSVWAWPGSCDIYDADTDMFLAGGYPLSNADVLDNTTLMAYARDGQEMRSAFIPEVLVEDGETSFTLIHLSEDNRSEDLTLMGRSGTWAETVYVDETNIYGQTNAVVSTATLNTSEFFIVTAGTDSYVYEVPEEGFSGGMYIIYVVDYPGGFFGPTLIVQLPSGGPEDYWVLRSVPT